MNIHIRLKLFISFMLIMLIFYASVPLQAGGKPVLYGKVFLQTSSGFKKALARVTIQLLELKKGQPIMMQASPGDNEKKLSTDYPSRPAAATKKWSREDT